ncbi:hypothetical protein GCM10009836_36310 [Pseudonocardia ailaonensis]|uniref:FAS1-like dehydratase domain-containing protein n=1 Tax=Pseudonocardia ailaonensis TaxID=367279 RepID=A0ABN2N658_9PSEU
MSYSFPLEPGKVREFAVATQVGHGRSAEVGTVIPPTFLAARVFWKPADQPAVIGDRMDRTRVLHAGEEFRFHGRVPAAGEVLTVTERLGDEWRKEGRRGGGLHFMTVVTEFRDADGVLVAEAISTAVETERAAEEGAR